jgi:hypothetical protein
MIHGDKILLDHDRFEVELTRSAPASKTAGIAPAEGPAGQSAATILVLRSRFMAAPTMRQLKLPGNH